MKMANVPDFTFFFNFFVPGKLHVMILVTAIMANMDLIHLLENYRTETKIERETM